MAIEELDDLINSFAEADRATVKEILERNKDAESRLTSQNTVYKAFVDGDTDALAKATKPVTPAVTSPTLDLNALDSHLDTWAERLWTSPKFTEAVETRAKTLAEQMSKAAEDRAVARGAYLSSEIFEIMDSHRGEFGKPLDRPAFEKFVTENAGKFSSLKAAHDAYVGEERVNLRIEKGVKERLAAQQTSEVPGTSLPTSASPLGVFIRHNAERTGAKDDASRGPAIDSAVKAFRELQGGRAQ